MCRRRTWPVVLLVVAAAVAGASCTEEVSTVVRVELRFPEGQDPLADVRTLRISVHSDAGEEQVDTVSRPASEGWRGLNTAIALGLVDLDPGWIVVEGTDSDGRMICAGESIPIPVTSGMPGRVAVFVQTLGTSGLAPAMTHAWRDHGAAYLSGGGVLLAGGPEDAASRETWVYALDLYEPVEMASFPPGDERSLVGLAPFGGGRALLWGGSQGASQAYTLTPARNVWEPLDLVEALHGAWPAPLWDSLPDGGVLALRRRTLVRFSPGSTPTVEVIGEIDADIEPETLTVISNRAAVVTGQGEVFAQGVDISNGSLRTVPQPAGTRTGHGAAVLSDGRLVLAGGSAEAGMNEDVEVLDAEQESWTTLESLLAGLGRSGATFSRLPDDRLVLAGGVDEEGDVWANAVVLDIDAGTATTIDLVSPRVGHSATALPMGTVLLIGGESAPGQALASVEILRPAR